MQPIDAANMAGAVVLDVGDRDFETAVIERSWQVPVVVDCWAPWCAPCRVLGPALERLAAEHGGAFVLAKVNVDENPAVAQAFAVQSIPTVLGFRDGQVVADFVGALPEAALREFLGRVLPSEADVAAAAGAAGVAAGNLAEAEEAFRRALDLDSRNARGLVGLAAILSERDQGPEALALLERVDPGPFRQEADRLAAQIRVQQAASVDEAAMRRKIDADPGDLEPRFLLGQVCAASDRYAEALELYLEIVRRDRAFRDDAARKAMLDLFAVLGGDHPLTERYRSQLAQVLFS